MDSAEAAAERPANPPLSEVANLRARAFYLELIRELRKFSEALDQGAPRAESLAPFTRLAENLISLMWDCPDEVMSCLPLSTPDDYLFGKQANLGVLAGRLASQMDESEENVIRNILTGWLLHTGLHKTARIDSQASLLSAADKKLLLGNTARFTISILESLPETDWARQLWEKRIERLDQPGLMAGNKTDQNLPLYMRIMEVAEVYEALTHPRPYRGRMLAHEAVKYVIEESGKGRFDGAVIKSLIQSLSVYPHGSYVELNNDTIAVVYAVHTALPTRPILRPVFDSSGKLVDDDSLLDLGETPMMRIQKAVDETELKLPNPKLKLRLRVQLWWPVE